MLYTRQKPHDGEDEIIEDTFIPDVGLDIKDTKRIKLSIQHFF